jgi:ABC-2 type transport system permease protein
LGIDSLGSRTTFRGDTIATEASVGTSARLTPHGLTRFFRLALNLAQRQLKLRYHRSALGWLWSLITPLATLITYAVVFGILLRVQPPVAGNGELRSFALFLFSGLIAWNLFSALVTGSMDWLLDLGPLLKKVAFRPEAPLIGGALASLVQTATEAALLVVIMASVGNISPALLTLPVTLLLLVVFAVGIGMIAAVTNVYLRDVENLVRVAMPLLFYSTPIVYPLRIVPEEIWGVVPLRMLVQWNPLTRFVDGVRGPLYGLDAPSLAEFGVMVGAAAISLGLGLLVFKRFGARLSEEL